MGNSKLKPGGGPSQRILFVDDDSSIREFAMELLSRSGYLVDVAEDGAVAWDILRSNRYDLLITDNLMPNTSGFELLRKLRAARLDMPVIMAAGTMPLREFTENSGVYPPTMLFKPYTGPEMLRTVNNVLNEAVGTTTVPIC